MPGIKNDVFSIKNLTIIDEEIVVYLNVNVDSEILKGHFPAQPVVPGACMLQLVKNVLELALKSNIRLKKAGQIRFLNMISPCENRELQLNVTFKFAADASYNVTAQLKDDEVICFKFQGSFVHTLKTYEVFKTS